MSYISILKVYFPQVLALKERIAASDIALRQAERSIEASKAMYDDQIISYKQTALSTEAKVIC